MLTLMVSYNMGASYVAQYTTEDRNDLMLLGKMQAAEINTLRYYVEGADDILCPLHARAIGALGATNSRSAINIQADRLRQAWACR